MGAHQTKITIKPDDIDILNHVNNIVYVKYFEKARFDWYQKIGLNFESLLEDGLGVVLRNLEISYIKEARLGDSLVVETIPYRLGNSSFTLKQKIINQHEEVITEAETVKVMIDLEKRKSIPLIGKITEQFKVSKLDKKGME